MATVFLDNEMVSAESVAGGEASIRLQRGGAPVLLLEFKIEGKPSQRLCFPVGLALSFVRGVILALENGPPRPAPRRVDA